jgi:GAF domain-containing protein
MTDAAALQRLIDITASLNSTLELDTLLGLVMQSATELLDGEACSLLLVDDATGDLVFEKTTRAGEEDLPGTRVPAGQGIAGWVAEHGRTLVVADPRSDDRFYGGIDEASGIATRNILAVPLKVKDRVIGVVEVTNKRGDGGFTPDDEAIAEALTNQAAIAIDNARLYASLARAVVTARSSYRL